MHQRPLLKTNNVITAMLLAILFFECNLNQKQHKDRSFNNIKGYFVIKNWDFPIEIQSDTVKIEYFLDSSIVYPYSKFKKIIEQMKILIADRNKMKQNFLSILSIPSTTGKNFGYVLEKPKILVDTAYYGTEKNPKIFFGLYVTRFSINKLKDPMPCEGCTFDENGSIVKKTGLMLLELNNKNDSLIFSRWGD